MNAFEAMKAGLQKTIASAKARDAARATVPEDIRVLHASDLGKCPVRLYYDLQREGVRGSRGYRRILFLNDGFMHEDELRDLLSYDNDLAISGGVQVPPYLIPNSNVQIWGEADIVAHEGASNKWVVESKAVYHATFERYVNNPASIPEFYFVQCAFYTVQLEADEGTLVIKDRERSEYYPDPWADEMPPEMVMSYAQAKKIIEARVAMVQEMLVTPPSIPDNVLDQCRFCEHHSTCFASILTGSEVGTPEPLVLVGGADGLSKNITEAIRVRRAADAQLIEAKGVRSEVDEVISDLCRQNNVKKIVSDEGTVIQVTRKGNERLSKKAKAVIEKMKQDGTLRVEQSPSSTYLRYSEGAKKE